MREIGLESTIDGSRAEMGVESTSILPNEQNYETAADSEQTAEDRIKAVAIRGKIDSLYRSSPASYAIPRIEESVNSEIRKAKPFADASEEAYWTRRFVELRSMTLESNDTALFREVEAAREKIILANLRLAYREAVGFYRKMSADPKIDLNDIIHNAYLGLIEGVDSFNPNMVVERPDGSKGNPRLSTYVSIHIRKSVRRQYMSGSGSRRLPEHFVFKLSKMRKVVSELGLDSSDVASDKYDDILVEKLSEKSNTTKSMLELLKREYLKSDDISLDFSAEPDVDNWNRYQTHDSTNVEQEGLFGTNREEILSSVQALISPAGLTEREMLVIEKFYGLDGGGETSLLEIGKSLNISGAMVSRIRHIAISKIRIAMRDSEQMDLPALLDRLPS